jgi:hypothetical protein
MKKVILPRVNAKGRKKRTDDEGGFILISVVVMCGILFLAAASQAALMVGEDKQLRAAGNDLRALALAEAGAERAVWELVHNDGAFDDDDMWAVDDTTATLSNVAMTGSNDQNVGSYTVTVENFDSQPVITSAATVDGVGESLNATVKAALAPVPLFQFAVLAEQPITMENNVTIDSYDPALGDYNANLGGGDRNVSENGDAGTLSTDSAAIYMENNATIKGNAQTGSGGGVSLNNHSSVTGETDDDISASISPVTVPAALSGLSSSGALSQSKKTTVTLAAGNYKYSSITMDNQATLSITGEVNLYVTGDILFQNNADLEIASGGTLNLYVDGNFTVQNNGTVNNTTEDPEALQLFATSASTIALNNNGDIHGLIYAPSATVDLENNAHVIGAVVAKTVVLENNAGVHYNEDLGTSGPTSGYTLDWWRRTS